MVLAQGGTETITGHGPTIRLLNPLGDDNPSIMVIINRIIDYLIYISIPILALMILWGGFQILAARDSVEKVKKGKETIQWAVIGFVIILISKGVALIVLRILG